MSTRTSSKRSNDAPAPASSATARLKHEIAHEPTITGGDSTAVADVGSSLCRYKTGRCTNTRVVKPNGALLLLCEFHRSQQNRTKKRSDMKYRQHRAKKRMVERQQAVESPRVLLIPDSTPDSVGSCNKSKKKPTRTHQSHRSDKLKAFADLFQKSDCAFSLRSPHKECDDSLFSVSSSKCEPSEHQHHLATRRTVHSSIFDLDLDDVDIVINSPTVKSMGDVDVDATSSVFPFCVSPLSSARRCGEPFWQPDDVRLLEYFIL